MLRGSVVVAIPLMLMLAGCAEPEAEAELDTLQVEPEATLGAVSGVVVDPTITPIANAVVTLDGPETSQETTTNEAGQFAFNDLEPGFYVLVASADGHAPVQSSTDVQAGQVSKPRMLLPVVVSEEPYHTSVMRRAANVVSTPAVVVYPSPEYIGLDGPFEDIVVEGEWTGTIVSLDPERTILTVLETDGWKRQAETGQQMHLVFNGTGVGENADELAWRSWPGFNTVAVDAFAELFFTIWYHEGAPEGWSIYDEA